MLAIRILRTMKKLTARELARRLGVPTTTWFRIEHGERQLPAELVEPLAAALSLSPDDLRRDLEPMLVDPDPEVPRG